MKKVSKRKEKVKAKRKVLQDKVRKLKNDTEAIDPKIELIQALIPIGLEKVNEELQKEVVRLAGERYSRGLENSRWGSQGGSIYLGDQKVPLQVPRVRNKKKKEEVTLDTYTRLQRKRENDEGLLRKVISGVSCRRYEESARLVPEVFGLSGTTVSRRYIEASAKKLKELRERRLDNLDIISIFIDGKVFAEDEMIIAVGITMSGEKVVLGFVQAAAENANVCKALLYDLIDRGLRYDEGILFVIDGSKGIRKAIRKVFREYGFVQRCVQHKKRNILDYLSKTRQDEIRKKLRAAYEEKDYKKARANLLEIKAELSRINKSAARSLEDGFEETLTLQKLGVSKELGRSFRSTNCIESIMSQVEHLTGRVCYWKNSDQKERWVSVSLLDIEPRLNKVNGYRHLSKLREAMKSVITERRSEESGKSKVA